MLLMANRTLREDAGMLGLLKKIEQIISLFGIKEWE